MFLLTTNQPAKVRCVRSRRHSRYCPRRYNPATDSTGTFHGTAPHSLEARSTSKSKSRDILSVHCVLTTDHSGTFFVFVFLFSCFSFLVILVLLASKKVFLFLRFFFLVFFRFFTPHRTALLSTLLNELDRLMDTATLHGASRDRKNHSGPRAQRVPGSFSVKTSSSDLTIVRSTGSHLEHKLCALF